MAENQPVIKVGESVHVAFNVKNLEKTLEFFDKFFGWGKWERRTVERKAIYRGKQVTYRGPRAIGRSGPVVFQIGESHGEGYQIDLVKQTGSGLNQFSFEVDDVSEAVAKLEKMGVPVLMAGLGEDGKN